MNERANGIKKFEMTGRVKGKREVRLIEGKSEKRRDGRDERKEVGRSGWMKGRT